MKQVLFSPFDFGHWLVLGFAAFLADLAEGANPMNWAGNFSSDEDWPEIKEDVFGNFSDTTEAVFASAALITLIAFLVVLAIAFALLVSWISSRGKFVFLDSCLQGKGHIKKPWAEYRDQGTSLFKFNVVFGLITSIVFIIVVVLAVVLVVPAAETDFEGPVGILTLIFFGIFCLIFTLAISFVYSMLENFVVPIMHQRKIGVMEAWRVFNPVLRNHLAEFVLFALLIFVLYMGFVVAIGLVGCLTCCVGFLLFAIPYVSNVALLPVSVGFRFLGPEFLAQFGPEFAFAGTGGVTSAFAPLETSDPPKAGKEPESDPDSEPEKPQDDDSI